MYRHPGLPNSEPPRTEFTNFPNDTNFWGIHQNSSRIPRPSLERAKTSRIRSYGQSNPVIKLCSAAAACRGMAGNNFNEKFKLIQATPLVNGKADPNPRVECLLCGIVFSGGVTRQRNHLLAQKGRDVRICTEIASLEPALLAELQHEQQQKQEQQLQQIKKRAASASSSSTPAKQQKLDGMLSRGARPM